VSDNKCPYYDKFSNKSAVADGGDDCIEFQCWYWIHEYCEGKCRIRDDEHFEQMKADGEI